MQSLVTTFNNLDEFIRNWGYWAVLVGVLIGATGVPLPLLTLVLLSGFYASTGVLRFRYVIIIVAIAAITGRSISYFIGRSMGRTFFVRYGSYFGVTSRRLERVEGMVSRHGNKTILVAPFVWGLRAWIGPICGITRVKFTTFFIYNAIAVIIWAVAMTSVGYGFGEHRQVLAKILNNAAVILAILVAFAGLIYYRSRNPKAE